jgi:hypothetical protein
MTEDETRCLAIAECMPFNLGVAFVHLWRSKLESEKPTECLTMALTHLKRFDQQRGPMPMMLGHAFNELVLPNRTIFNRPSPWCECVRYAMAAICDMCAHPEIRERSRLSLRAIQCVETALSDELSNCQEYGRGLEPGAASEKAA